MAHLHVAAVIISLYSLTGVESQTTICVWNSVDSWDDLNGEFTKQSALHNDHPYWQSVSNPCGVTNYIFASIYASESLNYWLIYPSLVSNYMTAFPDCESGFAAGTDTNPTICNAGWHEWHSTTNDITLPMTVTAGSCPSLQCDRIQVSGITTAAETVCNKIFSRNTQKHNVFVYNDMMYLYFNQYTFKWYCSDTLGADECDDANINHQHISSQSDGWQDINVGESATFAMSNGEDVRFDCLSTDAPTSVPSGSPITRPPTRHPTSVPSASPTTDSPTQTTGAPNTFAPTQNPSVGPTALPTTASPTQDTTTAPTNDPTTAPTNDPTTGPSGSPTTIRPTQSPIATRAPTSLDDDGDDDDGDDDDEQGEQMVAQGSQPLQMTSTQNVDTTGLTVALLIIGTFCVITTVVACVMWAKHEKVYGPIYKERKKQILAAQENHRIMKIGKEDRGMEQEEDEKPKKKTSVLLSKYEVELEDIKAGDMYEAQDGDVQFGAL